MAPGGHTWQTDAVGRDQQSVKSACNSGWTMLALTEWSGVNECLRLTFYFEHAAFGSSEASPDMTCKVMWGELTAELLLGLLNAETKLSGCKSQKHPASRPLAASVACHPKSKTRHSSRDSREKKKDRSNAMCNNATTQPESFCLSPKAAPNSLMTLLT